MIPTISPQAAYQIVYSLTFLSLVSPFAFWFWMGRALRSFEFRSERDQSATVPQCLRKIRKVGVMLASPKYFYSSAYWPLTE